MYWATLSQSTMSLYPGHQCKTAGQGMALLCSRSAQLHGHSWCPAWAPRLRRETCTLLQPSSEATISGPMHACTGKPAASFSSGKACKACCALHGRAATQTLGKPTTAHVLTIYPPPPSDLYNLDKRRVIINVRPHMARRLDVAKWPLIHVRQGPTCALADSATLLVPLPKGYPRLIQAC